MSAKLRPTATWRIRAWPGPGLPTATSSQRRTSGPPVSYIRVACAMVIVSASPSPSGRRAQRRALRLAVRRKAVRRERFVDVVVELADAADAARLGAVGNVAAELARNAHELLDLLPRAHLGLAVLRPE